jgi:hypothetical protein
MLPQRRERGQHMERVHGRPREREHRHAVEETGAAARGRAVAQPAARQQLEGARGDAPAGRPEAGDVDPEGAQRSQPPVQVGGLGVRVERRPILVAPRVIGELVSG